MTLLDGRVAIVTGGGRGLGRAMAAGLAHAGIHVLATASREQVEIDALQAAGVTGMLADVTKAADCARVVALALERWGRLDILVNNAGRGMRYVSDRFMTDATKFWEVPPETWRMVIDTNVNGPFLMARAAAPAMLRAGWGRIINVSMNHATIRRRGFSPYGPSKAALDAETAIWAQDLEGTGVTVNAILPGGATLTGMIPSDVSDAARARLLAPEVIVPPLLWLASPASNAITGRRLTATAWREDDPDAALEPA